MFAYFLGDGNGSFTTLANYQVDSAQYDAIIGDF